MKYGVMSHLSGDEGILMIDKYERENDPNSGLFTLPGGKLKDYEMGLSTPRGRLESAVRETEEETGLTLINPVLKGVVLFNNHGRIFDKWKNPEDFLVYIFSAEEYTGTLKIETEEGVPLWVKKNDLQRVPKNIGDERIYEWLTDGRNFVGVIKHKGKVLDEQGTFVDYLD